MTDRLRKQLAFILELDQEKNILRQTHLSNHGRRENDAEHAWHMAIMAYLLQEYSNAPIDVAKVMLMCLLHDVVEIDAGDTYAYDEKGKETQKAREEAAKERIYGLLPEDQKECFQQLFEEFEARETAESKFLPRASGIPAPCTNCNSTWHRTISEFPTAALRSAEISAPETARTARPYRRTRPGCRVLCR